MEIPQMRSLHVLALLPAKAFVKTLVKMSPPSPPPISSLIRRETRSHSSPGGATDPTSLTTHASTNWITLSTLSYRFNHDPPSTFPRRWDVASRTGHTPTQNPTPDAVVILARLVQETERLILVKQFRPPINAVTLELPAGLIDANETPETAALRELKEETGFCGSVVRVYPVQALSPGMTDERVVMVEVQVEAAGRQECEPEENIEVISVPIARLHDAIEYLVETEKCVPMHSVVAMALAMRLVHSLGVPV